MASLTALRDSFFEECDDLLESLTEGLGALDTGTAGDQTLNAVFRAVHSVKGGAGAFGLTALVDFAHRFETLLDALRSGRIGAGPDLFRLLLRAADHLADQVTAARTGAPAPDAAALTRAFATWLGAEGSDSPPAEEPFVFTALPLDLAAITADGNAPALDAGLSDTLPSGALRDPSPSGLGYAIHFRPCPRLYANGHDPTLILAALSELGHLQVTLDASRLPAWEHLDPADAWLAWTLHLTTAEPETSVREAFEFVEGLCDLDIRPLTAPAPPPAATPSPETVAAPPAATPDAPRSDARRHPGDDPAPGPRPTLRVDLERVDRLINAVGELIINQAMIEQSLGDLKLAADAEIIAHVEDFRLLARDLQEAVMAIRAQPVKPLFQRMSRILREAADATGKRVRLITAGDATEVDKTVVERLADPLTHMVRNAVDHGLEPSDRRAAAGKDPEGTIRLSAAHRSGSVVITLSDDGGGLDRTRIRDTAIRRGLIPSDADLTEAEVDALLFLPGFSTAATVSNLSGRGVGLDVVRNAVAALGGRIAIASVPGRGTEFTISLPLTLAVLDGLVISVAGQTMVIPISAVVETIRPGPGDLHRMGPETVLLAVRGRFLPMVDVAASLGFPARDPGLPPLVLLVETDGAGDVALIVDAVLDQRQVVIKGLEGNYHAIPGISAATVLGDGRIALILDAEALAATPTVPLATGLTGASHAHAAA
jgi:two-component system, chemotaxis family, sensor kinase CheA